MIRTTARGRELADEIRSKLKRSNNESQTITNDTLISEIGELKARVERLEGQPPSPVDRDIGSQGGI